MSTQWIYRASLLVESADQDVANDLATKIFPNGEAERDTFSVPLGASAQEMNPGGDAKEPTHYGAYGVLTLELFEKVRDAIESGVVPSLRFFAEDAGSGELVQAEDTKAGRGSRVPEGKENAPWDWEKSLGEMGLKTVAVDISDIFADSVPDIMPVIMPPIKR